MLAWQVYARLAGGLNVTYVRTSQARVAAHTCPLQLATSSRMPAKRAAARRRHGSQGAAAPFGSGWVILAAIVSLAVAGCQTTVAGQQEPGQAARHAADLDAVLLTTSEVDAAMAATGMAADTTQSTLVDDSAYTTPSACLAVSSMGQDHVYAGTGWTAARMQSVHEPGDDYAHLAHQAVVEFPTSAAADAFLTASAQKGWPACAPGHYTYAPGAGDDATGWDVGPATEKDHVLTVTITESDSDSWACQRALTSALNLAVDVLTCSANPQDTAATIAQRIAAKVTGQ